MTKKKEKEEVKEVAVVVPPKKELVLEGDPQAQLDFAMKAANALMSAIGQKKNPVMIRGEQYLEYGDWQTLARFFGATASIAWSKKLTNEKGDFIGYEARAEVLHNGQVISSAEAMCMKAEKNWAQRDEFMLRSMAQTRASSKALRNAYGWVAELAGMKATPAEEMGEMYETAQKTSYTVVRKQYDEEDNEIPPATAKPQKPQIVIDQENKIKEFKKRIKEMIDDIALVPLVSGREYTDWVAQETGLDLADQSIANLELIIERIEGIMNNEKED